MLVTERVFSTYSTYVFSISGVQFMCHSFGDSVYQPIREPSPCIENLEGSGHAEDHEPRPPASQRRRPPKAETPHKKPDG